MKKVIFAAILILVTGFFVYVGQTSAELTTQNCWGTVVSQRAKTYGDVGAHASDQEEPRIGVGNLAHKVFNMSVGDLASLLGTLDDAFGQDPLGATHCSN